MGTSRSYMDYLRLLTNCGTRWSGPPVETVSSKSGIARGLQHKKWWPQATTSSNWTTSQRTQGWPAWFTRQLYRKRKMFSHKIWAPDSQFYSSFFTKERKNEQTKEAWKNTPTSRPAFGMRRLLWNNGGNNRKGAGADPGCCKGGHDKNHQFFKKLYLINLYIISLFIT